MKSAFFLFRYSVFVQYSDVVFRQKRVFFALKNAYAITSGCIKSILRIKKAAGCFSVVFIIQWLNVIFWGGCFSSNFRVQFHNRKMT